jgi:tungstate transport system substrate-binding protein
MHALSLKIHKPSPYRRRRPRSPLSSAAAIAVALAALLLTGCRAPAGRTLLMATTTSVGHSGLLDAVATAYRSQAGVEVRPQLVGSGIALRMLADGNVDVVISHAPAAEAEVLRAHPQWRYRKVMFNDFVLVGPPADPAGVAGAATIEDAMRRIAGSRATFLSRGDRSGTHEREEQLWTAAGARPPADRLVVAGAGMGSTLRAASETVAYTLADRATYAQLSARLDLKVLFEGGSVLLNTYAVILDPAAEHAAEARGFADWLTDGAGREVIAGYRVGAGTPAFTPWPAGRAGGAPSDRPF